MRVLPLMLLGLSLSACDRISQRVWNCSDEKLDVLKANGPDFDIVETIPGRSWIASMKGGEQITAISVANGTRTKVLWQEGQRVLTSRSHSAQDVCAGLTGGIIVQQF